MTQPSRPRASRPIFSPGAHCGGRSRAALALAMLLAGGSALAQPAAAPSAEPAAAPMPQATGATSRFPIRGFEVTGDVPLSAAQISAVLDSFVGEGSLITLQQATEELENALKVAGFELHRVSLVPQDLGGMVKLEIVKFGLADSHQLGLLATAWSVSLPRPG